MSSQPDTPPWPIWQRACKRSVDLIVAVFGLALLGLPTVALLIAASIDTKTWGLFRQERIGRFGRRFHILKIRSMRNVQGPTTNVTTSADPRITAFGRILRRFKLDELPQLVNVLMGDMTLVGPRPDVPGFADALKGDDRIVLALRPGITGPATLRYRNEEELLAAQEDPETYNREVLYPAKVRLNRHYVERFSLGLDAQILLETALRILRVPQWSEPQWQTLLEADRPAESLAPEL